jgi:hypothetical protein
MVIRGKHLFECETRAPGQHPLLGEPHAHPAARTQGDGEGDGCSRGDTRTTSGQPSSVSRRLSSAPHHASTLDGVGAGGRGSSHLVRGSSGAQEGRREARARAEPSERRASTGGSPDGGDSGGGQVQPSRWHILTRADPARKPSLKRPDALAAEPWVQDQEQGRPSDDEVATKAREVARELVRRLVARVDRSHVDMRPADMRPVDMRPAPLQAAWKQDGEVGYEEGWDEWQHADASHSGGIGVARQADALSLSCLLLGAEGASEHGAQDMTFHMQDVTCHMNTGRCLPGELQLTAAGLEDARALLRTWIDCQDTAAPAATAGDCGALHPRASCDGGARHSHLPLPPLALRASSAFRCSLLDNASQGEADEDELERERVGRRRSSGPLPLHPMPLSASTVQDRLAWQAREGETEDDLPVAPQSRWQALFSRDAVCESVTYAGGTEECLDEPVERATEVWRRRMEEAGGSRASASMYAPARRSNGIAPAAPDAAGKRGKRVEARDVLSTLQMRHEMRASKREQRRALRQADPSPDPAPAPRLTAASRATVLRARLRTHDNSDEEAALRREIERVRAQVAQQSSSLSRRRAVPPPHTSGKLNTPAAASRGGGDGQGGDGGGNELLELRQRRLRRLAGQETVGDCLQETVAHFLAKQWSRLASLVGDRHTQSTDDTKQWSGLASRVGDPDVHASKAPDLVPLHQSPVPPRCPHEPLPHSTASDEEACADELRLTGHPLLGGEEWQKMLAGHVQGFSASLARRLSDWNAKQETLEEHMRHAKQETRDEHMNPISHKSRPGQCFESDSKLVVCAPPHDHPLRHSPDVSGRRAQQQQQQQEQQVAFDQSIVAHLRQGEDEDQGSTAQAQLAPCHTMPQHRQDQPPRQAADGGSSEVSSSHDPAYSVTSAPGVLRKVLAQREGVLGQYPC